jgi:hypothetical protein
MQSSTRAIHPQEYEYIEGGDFRVPLRGGAIASTVNTSIVFLIAVVLSCLYLPPPSEILQRFGKVCLQVFAYMPTNQIQV